MNVVYLLSYAYGITLYQLDSQLELNWPYQAMPAYFWLYVDLDQVNATFILNTDDDPIAFSNVRHAKADIATGSTEWDINMSRSKKVAENM